MKHPVIRMLEFENQRRAIVECVRIQPVDGDAV